MLVVGLHGQKHSVRPVWSVWTLCPFFRGTNTKHILGSIYVFFTVFGYGVREEGGGSPKGLVHILLMQFYTVGDQTSKFPKLILRCCDHLK